MIEEVYDVRDIACFVIGSKHLLISASLVVYDVTASSHVVREATDVLVRMGATKTTIQVVERSFYAQSDDGEEKRCILLKDDEMQDINLCEAI